MTKAKNVTVTSMKFIKYLGRFKALKMFACGAISLKKKQTGSTSYLNCRKKGSRESG